MFVNTAPFAELRGDVGSDRRRAGGPECVERRVGAKPPPIRAIVALDRELADRQERATGAQLPSARP